jgi:predicted nuclease with TOPRIM domain
VEEQQGQIEALRRDLKAADDAVKAKELDVNALHGKVMQIQSHALKLEEELRALRSGEVSNVHRVSEIREELELAQETAGVLLDCRV